MTHGMLLGKFLPPHLGHCYLVDFARAYVDRLTIVVGSLPREPIPGALRFAWMREMFPDCEVVHIDRELPQYPHEHPEFWAIWRAAIREVMPTGPDYVFASEDYGDPLAELLGATYVPVDHARDLVPISGTAIRADPLGSWRYLPPAVRPYFAKRVCVFGPESTGKTTLTRQLAARYETAWVAEYARPLLDRAGGVCTSEDIPRIARGQMASEDALVRQANRVLFCDTDVLTTTIWSEALFGDCPAWIREQAARRRYDLTLLLDVDVPWVQDGQRFFPDERASFLARCEAALQAHGRPYLRISGDWDARLAQACAAVDRLLG